jgi:uncharacterized membrane protein YeaQ/YmgE (transglycosylase-associated protein family)
VSPAYNDNKGEIMDVTGLVIFLAIGAVAGWLAGTLMKGGGFGLLGNIVIGIIGAVVGGFVFGLLGITAGGLLGAIITSTAGAVILLFVVRLFKQV